MENLDKTVERLMADSEFGCMTIHHKDGLAVSIKGTPVETAFCLARIVYDMHKKSHIPLELIGIMLNSAVECLIEEENAK